MTHGSLFSGIGGFDLAAHRCRWENIFQVEIDEYCRIVLQKQFPNSIRFKDIKEFNGAEYKGRIDVISGGFPCQPFSVAGQQRGSKDERNLWCEMFRVITEIRPRWVVAENVPNLLNVEQGAIFEQILTDLETIGYETQTLIIPAAAVNAPHRRDRLWIIANSISKRRFATKPIARIFQRSNGGYFASDFGRAQENSLTPDTERNGGWSVRGQKPEPAHIRTAYNYPPDWGRNWLEVAAELCGVDDGLSAELDGFKLSKVGHRNARLKALGNAIVPQIAYEIFKAIDRVENE